MSLSEFEIIRQYLNRKIKTPDNIRQGIGDDAAIVNVPPGMELALSMDTLVQDVHFLATTRPQDIGYKALAVSLSDMAAMGAEPRWATLSLTIPEADQVWIEKFAQGFFELADNIPVTLVGGDLTRGPLSVTVQLHGLLPTGEAILRHGAQPGDLVYVSGFIGEAGLGLRLLNGTINIPQAYRDKVLHRLHRPEPRIALGIKLRNQACSAIDISDGLFADLGHMLDACQCGAIIYPDAIPLSEAFGEFRIEDAWEIALTSGDDYELCFTIHEEKKKIIDTDSGLNIPLTCIGKIVTGSGIQLIRCDGTLFNLTSSGYHHF